MGTNRCNPGVMIFFVVLIAQILSAGEPKPAPVGTSAWCFIRDSFESWVHADPVDSSFFGDYVRVTLRSNADNIAFTVNGTTEPDPENPEHRYTGPFICLGDTVIIKAKGFGSGYAVSTATWRYYRRYISVIVSRKGTIYNDSAAINLTPFPFHPFAKIYYTLDGTHPRINGPSTKLYLNNTILLRKTTILKAVAVAPNAVSADTLSQKYIIMKTQNVAY